MCAQYEMILKNTSRVMINFSLSNQWELLYSSDGVCTRLKCSLLLFIFFCRSMCTDVIDDSWS